MNDLPGIDWVHENRNAAAKAAALAAAAALPEPDPVPTVGYRSEGRTVVIGSGDQALRWADLLAKALPVTLLLTDEGTGIPALSDTRPYPVVDASAVTVSGWLGAFILSWREPASPAPRQGQVDLVLDLSATPLIAAHQPPHGYFAPGTDDAGRLEAVQQLTQLVGDFEKPKYFKYKEKLCAHSRNRKVGCSACIEICSAKAIESAGDRIRVNPNLCAGCGACSTVCPSGALGYAYPGAPYTGARLQTVLRTYASEGGAQPVILFYGEGAGSALVGQLDPEPAPGLPLSYRGIPGRVIPMQLYHAASTGIDVWLAAVAYGASGITVLTTDADAPQYAAELERQMAIAQALLSGMGYEGIHFQLIRANNPDGLAVALQAAPDGAAPPTPAGFHVAAEKRITIDLALAHLFRSAPVKPAEVALPAGSPFGAIVVNSARCSMCMSCVGSCPESALMDNPSLPQLRFVEKNCVQCGLCATTCPENAITLVPRMSFTESWNKAVLLNETQPFHCIRCDKPFGTLLMIQNMLGKLSQHSAFSGHLDRLKMCGDCRVIDMMEKEQEVGMVERKRPRT